MLFPCRPLEHNHDSLRSLNARLHFVYFCRIHHYYSLSCKCQYTNLHGLSSVVVCCGCLREHHWDPRITSCLDGRVGDHFCCGYSACFIHCTSIPSSCIYFFTYFAASVLRNLLPGLETHLHPKLCGDISCLPVRVDRRVYTHDAAEWSRALHSMGTMAWIH